MSASTLDSHFATDTTYRLRSARVAFCDREDAEMFLEWLRIRSEAQGTPVTFPLFVCTAADAYSVSSALTYAVFGEIDVSELPDTIADRLGGVALPAVLGPARTADGWEIVFAISRR